MEDKILELLNQLVEGQKDTNQRLGVLEDKVDRVEIRIGALENQMDTFGKKLDAVVEQTANLSEFRTEMKDFEARTDAKLEENNDRLSNVEIITATNWKDIVKMKSVI